MSYLIRKTDTFLRNWKKNPDRYPLIISLFTNVCLMHKHL